MSANTENDAIATHKNNRRAALERITRHVGPNPAKDLCEQLATARSSVDEFKRRGYPDPRAAAGLGPPAPDICDGDIGGICGFGALD